MKHLKRLTALLLSAIVLLNAGLALAIQDGFRTTYTYNYDYWGDIAESPDAYRVQQVIYSSSLGLETPMRRPQSLYVRGQEIYVCDTGNNRILQLKRDGNEYSLVRIIDRVSGAEPETFNAPGDVFADEEGNVYICDTNNNRVLMADKDLRFVRSYIKPVDNTFDQNIAFLPSKMVVDTSGRVYVRATDQVRGGRHLHRLHRRQPGHLQPVGLYLEGILYHQGTARPAGFLRPHRI